MRVKYSVVMVLPAFNQATFVAKVYLGPKRVELTAAMLQWRTPDPFRAYTLEPLLYLVLIFSYPRLNTVLDYEPLLIISQDFY